MLGPVAGDAVHGQVAFDPTDCRLHLATVDLDGGNYNHDVRVARVWDGTAWRWADDWEVKDGRLLRPGRAPMAVDGFVGLLEVDVVGRVTARTVDGRRLEMLRGADGHFIGMRSGSVAVEFTETGLRASDGREVNYTLSGDRIDSVESVAGSTRYQYAGATLSGVTFADGASLTVDGAATSGLGGHWRCERGPDGATVTSDTGRWRVSTGPETRVTDPAGAVMQTTWSNGRLFGWTDPDGHRVSLDRDGGRVDAVVADGERIATLRWGDLGLRELVDQEGGRWLLERSSEGTGDRAEPDGRTVRREAHGGQIQVWQRGAESATAAWDSAGRARALRSGSQGEVRIERDAAGRIVQVFDGAGGAWRVERGASGATSALVDPAGARWEVRVGPGERLDSLTRPDGERVTMVRSEGRLSQLIVGATRWSWLRDAAGRLTGFRDGEGRLTSLTRSAAGPVGGIRWADGSNLTVGRDPAGRVRTLGSWRLSRDSAGRVVEVRDSAEVLAGWSRDGSGRVSGFSRGDEGFDVSRDGAGRVVSVRAGEGAERWRLDRDAAGRVGAVVGGDGRTTSVLRDSAGLVNRVVDELGTVAMLRDLRGRITKLTAGDRSWVVSRDVSGRVVRVEVAGIGVTGADYERDGALSMVRLADGLVVRRNTSDSAGELLATDKTGGEAGSLAWTLDGSGRLLTLGGAALERDPAGALVAVRAAGGEWAAEAGLLSAPDGTRVHTDSTGAPLRVELPAPGAWGLGPGEATYRWTPDGRLGGLDGTAGTALLIHDGLGRLSAITLAERTVPLLRDGFGRLRAVGAALVGWDALLAVGDAPRAPFPDVVVRPGSAVFFDPRGYAAFAPWAGVLSPWPGGWMSGVDAAEAGPGGRFVGPGGVLLDLSHAYDPLSGRATSPDRWPWARSEAEQGPAPSPFSAPDAATPAWWDATAFDAHAGWSDVLGRLSEVGVLPGGGPEPEEAPGLPWLPSSFARTVPAPVAGGGGICLDEDPAGRLVLRAALRAEPLDSAAVIREFLTPELHNDAIDVPGVAPLLPPFLNEPLAVSPFGH